MRDLNTGWLIAEYDSFSYEKNVYIIRRQYEDDNEKSLQIRYKDIYVLIEDYDSSIYQQVYC